MRVKTILIIVALVGAALTVVVLSRPARNAASRQSSLTQSNRQGATTSQHVPAFYETPPPVSSLAPVLPPEQFTGKTREAYRAVREIPQTIAQMPCYCNCDEGFGHKSLHSCFEGTHASQCAVCVGEALTAYKLQKEQGLSAPEIRERIIAEYSKL